MMEQMQGMAEGAIEGAAPRGVEPTLAGAAGKPVDTKLLQAQIKKYSAVLIHLMYSKEMKEQTVNMISSSDDPFISIPMAANQVIKEADRVFKKQGIEVSNVVRLSGAQIVVADMIEIGKAKGFFQIEDEEVPALFEDTLQLYIENGLKDGSIDPIQLQIDGEQLMTKEQRAGGQALGQHFGVPMNLSQAQIMEQYGNQRALQGQMKAEDNFSRERARMAQAPPQRGGQNG